MPGGGGGGEGGFCVEVTGYCSEGRGCEKHSPWDKVFHVFLIFGFHTADAIQSLIVGTGLTYLQIGLYIHTDPWCAHSAMFGGRRF